MYKQNRMQKTSIRRNESIEGETIEMKIERIVNNKEPISDGAPLIYQERSAGVEAQYDIRTDRWEVAVDAMDAVSKASAAKREQRHLKVVKEDGKPESIQGQAEAGNGTEPAN